MAEYILYTPQGKDEGHLNNYFSIKNLTRWVKKEYLLSRWRRRRRRKKNIRLNIGNLKGLFQKFDEYNISYVVLRWFDEIPLTPKEEEVFKCDNDIDILINTEDLKLLSFIASQHSGNIKCDVYSLTGRKGMSFSKIPYYPPALTSIILNKSERYRDAFYIPEPLTHFRSLAYHLVYHKGLNSGIPTGCHLESCLKPKRCYSHFLTELGQSLNVGIKQPYTLLGLHEYLKQSGWEMPYDLLERWPQKTNWHKFLLQRETDILRPWAEKLPGLLAFFIRQDLIEYNKTEMVYQLLEEKFRILKIENLTQQQTNRVMQKVRGGNWIAHNGTWVIPPKIAVICYDHSPVAVHEADVDKIRSYPHVKNENVFHKLEIRLRLAKTDNTPEKIFGIHGSDNAYEAQHMLHAIYTENTSEVNQKILEKIQRSTA